MDVKRISGTQKKRMGRNIYCKWGSKKRWVFQNFVRFLFRNTLDSDDIRENLL